VTGIGSRHDEAIGQSRRAIPVHRCVEGVAGKATVTGHVEAAIPTLRQIDLERHLG
jgi:hypothetical protein